MPSRYDAIVVGSGPNGLAAAITLAEHGRSVLVVEEQPHPGGGLRTEELTLPGFRHDVFSAVHPAAAASPAFARWPLHRHGLTWVHPEIAMAHPLGDDRAVVLHRDLERTRASLNADRSGDGDRWAAFAAPYLRSFGALRATMLGGFPPVKGTLALVTRLGPTGTLELARIMLMSAESFARERFRGDAARAWLYGCSLHGDVAPARAGSAIPGIYLMLLGHAVGFPSPRGGAGALADALVGHARSLGVALRTDARAERIVVRRGRVVGAQVAGEIVEAPRLLCDVTPHELLAIDARDLPADYRRQLARYRYGPPVVKVDWALNGPIPWNAPAVRTAGTVHVGGGVAAIDRHAGLLAADSLPPEPFLLLGQQSLADPTRAPAGMHTAWAYTRLPRQATEQAIEAHVERIEAQVARFADGFRERILARHVLSPAGLEARNRNVLGGDVGAGSYALDQLLLRPIPSLSPYRTPIRGLYLASAATFPGGAVHGVCGVSAARCALHDSLLRR
ncbi:MAG TPA: NAD(P)/FAD-dependent oxidoreductase [Conexibacter sp.]|nr:NAD(P)/FAD-dependent oxidoreductase [Conexibacter sp.]